MSAALHSTTVGQSPEQVEFGGSSQNKKPDRELIPLSFAQQRLWFLEQLEPNTPLYNIPTLARIKGKLDFSALERALNAVVERHEILRTRIVCHEDTPSQMISESEKIDLQYVDLLGISNSSEAEAQRVIRAEMNRPFDLVTDLLVRALVVRTFPEEHLLAVTMHHIVSDEWSVKIFFRDLSEFYQSFVEKRIPSLQELPIQYADYSIWQRDWLQGEVLEQQLEYWKEKLRNSKPPLALLTDHPRTMTPTFKGGNVALPLSKELAESLRKMANRENATLFMVLLAGLKALLHRYTGSEDIVVGSPIAGRNNVEAEELIGLFVNTLALRTEVTGNLTFRELLSKVRETTLGAYAHQEVPFEKIVEAVQPERSSHHLRFTNVMFVLQQSLPETRFSGLELRFPDVVSEMSKFELTVIIQETSQGLVARAEYNADLFEEATVARLLEHLETLLEGAAVQPEQRLSQVPLLTKKEFQQIVFEWNRTTTKYPKDKCVHQLFETQAALTPTATAILFANQQLTYRELNSRANQLAHFLKKFSVGPDVPVGICINRSVEMVVGLLAILKAGGAYVPLDSSYPPERLKFMLEDSQASVLLTEQPLLSRLPRNVSNIVCLDTDWELIARESRQNPQSTATAESLAYIMYTSGSTGTPKGVSVPHRAINRLVSNTNYIQFSNSDRIAQLANLSFDAATFEIWGALLNGGQLIGITTDVALSPNDFARELREYRISGMFLTAALFNQLAAAVPGAFATVGTVIVGGEALDPKWTRATLQHGPPRRLLNGYGPTENTTFSCCHLIKDVPEDATNVPIGRPIANTTVYLLDQYQNPVPIGVAGNLYVGGDGLARGYWNRRELTAEKFVANPFGEGLLYHTGDLARYLPNGVIEFLGRKDGQVKMRGFRVELGEIEAILSQHKDVRECSITMNRDESGQKRLAAYIVPSGDRVPNASDLRRFLGEKVPQYMVPAVFVPLARLPLTPNGKVDRNALPEPDQARPELEKEYTAPRDDVEMELTRIWEEVLGVHPIGIEDKFFDLGGHSLLAVQLIGRVAKSFEKNLRLATVFQAPTIRQMAAILRDEKESAEATRMSSLVEIQPRGPRPPLFLVHGAGGGMFWGYVNLARHLGSEQPVYGFRSRGLEGNAEFARLEDMAAQYINDMRALQPHGPYYLGGYCFGGNVAYEMARQLSACGEEAGLLALINCAPPNSSYGRLRYTPTWFVRFLRNLLYWASYSAHWTTSQRQTFLRWKLQMARKNLKALTGIDAAKGSRLDVENMVDLSSFSPEQQKLWETHIRAQFDYKPQPFNGRVHLFRSPGHPVWCSFDPQYGWGELARGGVEVFMVPAGHEKILEEPFVKVVADGLQSLLQPKPLPRHIRGTGSQTSESPSANSPPPKEAVAPLSFAQQRIWFLNQLEKGNPAYQQVVAFQLEGSLNLKALEEALSQIVQRHEILRTVYSANNGQPVGQVTSQKLTVKRIVSKGTESIQQQVLELAKNEKCTPFDLSTDIPIRASLLAAGPNLNALVVALHEIAADAASIEILLKELSSIYAGREAVLAGDLPIQYSSFAEQQARQLTEGTWSEHLRFFREQLAGAPEMLEFPADFSRPAQQSYCAKSEKLVFTEKSVQLITESIERLGVNKFEFFGTAAAVLLKRYIRQEESVISTFVDGREEPQLKNLIGNFENLILLRTDFSGDPAFVDLLGRFRQTAVAAMAHKELPFEKLLQELRPARDQSYHPLTQVLFTCRSPKRASTEVAGLRINPLDLGIETTKFDLTFRVLEEGQGMALQVDYASDLFSAQSMRRLLAHWQRLIEGITKNPEHRLSQLPILTPEEKAQLKQWNDTQQSYPKDKTLVDLFSEQAARSPDAVALVSGETRLSYRELWSRAKVVAEQLGALGVGNETLVGICLERSWEMVAGILGTLQAGAAYVPMDPAYPQERIEFMAKDARLRVILTQRKLLDSLPSTDARTICVEDLDWETVPAAIPETGIMPKTARPPKATDLAYVIYTSGSTGQPKGVALEHRNAVAFVYWARSVFSAEELDGVLASTSICFDLSIFEMFVPLSWGGKIILSENALALPNLPAIDEVKLINTVPSAIRELLRAKAVPPSVRVVNLAGEPLPTPLVDQIYAESGVQKVFDLYGPTETTTYSTYTLRKPKEPATIGRPLTNEQVYLLDNQRQLVPIGVPGELYIGGAGLAREYLHRPELTAERFVRHPFQPNERLYKTGDLARWRNDGNLEFLGRIDHQVKIRGFRIELGEVESALKKESGVSEAVVMAREDQSDNKRLVAYVVHQFKRKHADTPNTDQTNAAWSDELRRGLRQYLPEYMLPSAFVFLDALPLTPNGKVDRKALPLPETQRNPTASGMDEPRTPDQERIAGIWSEVLQLERVGLHDNFFDLGGHSLLAFQVISRLRAAFNVEIPLSGLFETPTVAALAEAISKGRWHAQNVVRPSPGPMPREGDLPASFVQERLWFLDQLNPGSAAYNVPLALRLKGPLNIVALQHAIDEVVARHEALRTTFRCVNGAVTQVITSLLQVKIRLIERPATRPANEAELEEVLNAEAQVPFDLSSGPLIRAVLVRMNETDHALLVVMHHTVSDGWSLAIFFRELEAFYHASSARTPMPSFTAMPVQYADFAQWQRGWMQGRVLEQELNYWKQSLKGAPPRIDLPTDRAEPVAPSGRADRRSMKLSSELSDKITAISHTGNGTPFMVLLTALGVTLQKWTGQRDMVIGTVVAGRNHEEIENVIGCFMNFLPIRIRSNGAETGDELLGQIRSIVLEAQSHQDCPFEKIVEAINPERNSNQNPLYNVGLLLQNFSTRIFHTDTVESALMPINLQAALLDLRFEAEQTAQGFTLTCEYRTELFDDKTIDELLVSLRGVLETLVQNPKVKIDDLKATAALEVQATRAPNRKPRQTIGVAATFTAEPLGESLSYWTKELDLPAHIEFAPYNQIFQQLLDPTSLLSGNQQGLNVLLLRLEDWQNSGTSVEPKDPFSLENVQRSANELVTALKSTAARRSVPCLVCICPPSNKIVADSARFKHLIRVERALSAELESVTGVYVSRSEDLWKWYPVADYHDPSGDELGHVPYTPMLYTALGTFIARKLHTLNRQPYKVIALDCDQTLWSGVCGEEGPEGITLDSPRRALQEFMRAQQDAGILLCLCSKNNEEDVLQVFSHHKEMPLSYENFVASRLNWRSKSENLKSLAEELKLGLESFIFVDDNPVECAAVQDQCPEVLTLLLPENVERIPQFLNHCWAFDQVKTTTEDRSRTEMYQQNQQRQQFLKQAVSLSSFLDGLELRIQIEPITPERLGRAAQLTQRTNQFNFTTVRRTENELQTTGRTAEILTVNVTDRFGDYGLVGVMIYRCENAALEVDTLLLSCRVLGRGVEHQMLARLGELAQEKGLAWVDVHFIKSTKNKPALDFLETIGAQFRQALNGGYLYRFPAEIAASMRLDDSSMEPEPNAAAKISSSESSTNTAVPLVQRFNRYRELALESFDVATIHKSIDAKAVHRSSKRSGYVPPRTELERQLCEFWQRLLRIERVGILDNFFDLGGHSLLAVRLFAEVEKLTTRKLPLVTLFQAPTVEQLAEILTGNRAESGPRSLLVPIQPKGVKPPLFLVHGAGGDVLWGYANLAAHLPGDQPVYGIKSRAQDGLDEWETLEEMAVAYLQEVRALQPEGPYNLGGYCFGGNVAYEMARRLRSEGESVGLLALLDSAPSNAGYETITWWRPRYAYEFARNLYYWWTDFVKLDTRTRIKFIERKARALGRKLWQRLSFRQAHDLFDIEDVIDPALFPKHEINLWKIHLRALTKHVQQPYSGKAVLFRTRGQPLFSSLAGDFCWGGLVEGGVEVKSIPGSHESIFVEPNVQNLAKELAAALLKIQSSLTETKRSGARPEAIANRAAEQLITHHDLD